MRILDELHLGHSAMGSRQLRDQLSRKGYNLNRKRVQPLMLLMGLKCVYPPPNTIAPYPKHRKFPYRLRILASAHPDHVSASDITNIPMAKIFMCLVDIMVWHSRAVLSWRLSNTIDSDFCVDALYGAIEHFCAQEIFITDQSSQFTSEAS